MAQVCQNMSRIISNSLPIISVDGDCLRAGPDFATVQAGDNQSFAVPIGTFHEMLIQGMILSVRTGNNVFMVFNNEYVDEHRDRFPFREIIPSPFQPLDSQDIQPLKSQAVESDSKDIQQESKAVQVVQAVQTVPMVHTSHAVQTTQSVHEGHLTLSMSPGLLVGILVATWTLVLFAVLRPAASAGVTAAPVVVTHMPVSGHSGSSLDPALVLVALVVLGLVAVRR